MGNTSKSRLLVSSRLSWLAVSFSATIIGMKPGISAVVIAYNQGDLLQKCLASLTDWVDEIVVVDLESTDDIATLAHQYNADYHREKKVAIVEKIRQKSLQYVKHEYVLFLDPDETIPTTLAKAVQEKINTGTYDYFVTPRQNIVFGKWLEHSRWWPDLQTRIFRVGKVTWPTTLHGVPHAEGTSYTFPDSEKSAIHHENYRSLDEFIEKNMRYAKTDATERLTSSEPLSLSKTITLSVGEVMSRFFLGKGYLDGMHGLVLSMLQSFYYFMVYAYYWELKEYETTESEKNIKSFPRAWFSHGLTETLYWEKSTNLFSRLKNKLTKKLLA